MCAAGFLSLNPPRRDSERFYFNDTLDKIWSAALEAAGLPYIQLKNATRHILGMQAFNLYGWGLDMVGIAMGHTSGKHTRLYAQAGVERLRGLIDVNTVVRVDRESGRKVA